MRLELRQLSAALTAPFVSADGLLHERELVLVSLEGRDGAVGWGEAAPLGVSAAQVREALEAYRTVLADGDDGSQGDLLAGCARAAELPEALAAIDLALWDLAGRRVGEPVWRLLGAPPRPLRSRSMPRSPRPIGPAPRRPPHGPHETASAASR